MPIDKRAREIWNVPISTDKHMIQYYVWYKYLRLAVDMEQNDIPITVGKKHYKVSVNHEQYIGWDIDTILKRKYASPEIWWDQYKHLFAEISVVEILYPDQFEADFERYRYFKISRIKKVSEVISELRHYLDEQKRGKKSGFGKTARFVMTGEVRERAFGDAFDALKMKLNEYSAKEIASILVEQGDDSDRLSDQIWYRSDGTFNSSKMRDTLNLAKRTVLAVADGYFPKNPNKQYF